MLKLLINVPVERPFARDVVDVYVALVVPWGDFYCLTPSFNWGPSNTPLAVVQYWEEFPIADQMIGQWTLPPDLPSGTYQAYVIFNRPGTSVLDGNNWIRSGMRSFEIKR